MFMELKTFFLSFSFAKIFPSVFLLYLSIGIENQDLYLFLQRISHYNHEIKFNSIEQSHMLYFSLKQTINQGRFLGSWNYFKFLKIGKVIQMNCIYKRQWFGKINCIMDLRSKRYIYSKVNSNLSASELFLLLLTGIVSLSSNILKNIKNRCFTILCILKGLQIQNYRGDFFFLKENHFILSSKQNSIYDIVNKISINFFNQSKEQNL